MALLSQAGGAYTVPSGHVSSKIRTTSVSGCVRNLRMKEGFVSSYSRTLYTNSVLKSSKRGHQLIVAASPPTEEAVVATEPLTREDLIAYLASGCKTKDKWRIGTEHEKFGFEVNTLRPMKYDQIAELLNSIAERFEWEKVMEGDKIIGLKQGKQSISLEPGGQFELSGAPLETLHQTCAEVNSHLYQVKAVAEEMGIGFLGMGFQPKWRREDIPIMPKGRYDIMRNYMPKVGSLGLDMMLRTCTVQVNLDFSSEADMIRKFRVGLALQPIATALFANSPFTEGKPNGFLSMRRFLITWFSFSIYLKAFQIHKISGLEDFQTTTKKSSRRLPGSLLTESFLMSPFHNISERFENCRKSFKRFFHFGMAGSSANSNMNQTGTSETPALKRNSKDVAWEYGMLCNPSNPDKVKCKLCGKLFSGGAFRIKEHIAKIPGNVSACPLSTKDDQEKCKNAIDEAKKKKKSKRSSDADLRNSVKICDVGDEDDEAGAELEELRSKKIPRTLGPMDKCASDINPRLSSMETRQQNISDALCKDRLHKVHQYIGRWVFASGVPFHATANDEFKLMLEAVGQFGSGVTPPSQYLLREPLLKEEVAAEYNLHAKPKHSTDNVNMSKID